MSARNPVGDEGKPASPPSATSSKNQETYSETCFGAWTRTPKEQKGGTCLGVLFVKTSLAMLPENRSSGTMTVVMQKVSDVEREKASKLAAEKAKRHQYHEEIRKRHKEAQQRLLQEQQQQQQQRQLRQQQQQQQQQQPQQQNKPTLDPNRRASEPGLVTSAPSLQELSDSISKHVKIQTDSLAYVANVIFSKNTLDKAGSLAKYTIGNVYQMVTGASSDDNQ